MLNRGVTILLQPWLPPRLKATMQHSKVLSLNVGAHQTPGIHVSGLVADSNAKTSSSPWDNAPRCKYMLEAKVLATSYSV